MSPVNVPSIAPGVLVRVYYIGKESFWNCSQDQYNVLLGADVFNTSTSFLLWCFERKNTMMLFLKDPVEEVFFRIRAIRRALQYSLVTV